MLRKPLIVMKVVGYLVQEYQLWKREIDILACKMTHLGMRLAPHALQTPPKRVVYVLDDVFRTGGTFKAMQGPYLMRPGSKLLKVCF